MHVVWKREQRARTSYFLFTTAQPEKTKHARPKEKQKKYTRRLKKRTRTASEIIKNERESTHVVYSVSKKI